MTLKSKRPLHALALCTLAVAGMLAVARPAISQETPEETVVRWSSSKSLKLTFDWSVGGTAPFSDGTVNFDQSGSGIVRLLQDEFGSFVASSAEPGGLIEFGKLDVQFTEDTNAIDLGGCRRTITSAAGTDRGVFGPILFYSLGSSAEADVGALALAGILSGRVTLCIEGFPPAEILDEDYSVSIPRDATPVVGPLVAGASVTGGRVEFTSFYGLPGIMNWQLVPDGAVLPDACEQPNASTIECENQVLRESLPLAGTAFALVYSSGRAAGRTDGNPVGRAHAEANGGWNLSIHHRYDPSANTIFWGAGQTADSVTLGTIAAAADGSFLITSGRADRIFHFDQSGRHLQTRDAVTGLPIYRFAYDPAGRLVSVTDEDALITRVERDISGAISAFVSPFGLRSAVTTTATGLIASVTDPNGAVRRMTYGSGGLLASYTNARNFTSTFTYGTDGRLVLDADAGSGRNTLARVDRPDGSYEVRLTTAENRVTAHNVDPGLRGGETRRLTTPFGVSGSLARAADNSLTAAFPDGTRVTTRLDPDPRFGRAAPIASGSVVTPSGLRLNLDSTRTVVLDNPTVLDRVASLTESTSLNGKLTVSRYDASARTLTTTTPEGRTQVARFDEKGRAISQQVDGLFPLQVEYDAAGRQSAVRWGAGNALRTSRYTYGPGGFLESVSAPDGRQLTYSRDSVGRVTRKVLPSGSVIDVAYDGQGNPTSIAPPGRAAHSFAYSAVDLRTDYLPPVNGLASSATRYIYSADRNLSQVNLPDGRNIRLSYDSAGQLSSVGLARGSVQLAYSPSTNQVSTVTSPDGVTVQFGFDGWLPISESWAGAVSGRFTRNFDNDFRQQSTQVNNEAPIPVLKDRDGLTVQAGGLSIQRNARTGLVIGAGIGVVRDSMSYTGFGETAGHRVTAGGRVLYDVQYNRDVIGRILTRVESVQGVRSVLTYSYDAAGRLTQVRRNGVVVATYGYDTAGNRLTRSTPGSTESGTYDAQDRAVSYAGNTFAYREDGQLLSRSSGQATTSFDYDELGNLVGAVLADGRTLSYVIDGQGRRVGKRVDGTLQQGFLYDGTLRIVAELDGSSGVVSRFVYGARNDLPEYMLRGGVAYRIVGDHLGSPRLVINTVTAEVVQRLDYDEFGRVIADSNPGFQPFGFAGGLYDRDVQLVRFGARDYDPQLGRWTARDPLLFGGGLPNLYLYVGNDPINRRDPSGLADPDSERSFSDQVSNAWDVFKDSVKQKVTSILESKAEEVVVETVPELELPLDTWKKGKKLVDTIDEVQEVALEVKDAATDLTTEGTGPEGAWASLKCMCRALGAFSATCVRAVESGESTGKKERAHQGYLDPFARSDEPYGTRTE